MPLKIPTRVYLASITCALLATTGFAETFKLTSLEWPPYSGDSLSDKGSVVAKAKAAFAAQGHTLEVTFYPWQRAVDEGLNPSSAFVGYFPEYKSDNAKCLWSQEIDKSPLGLAQQSAKPISWNTLDDLKTLKVGVVSGYVNTAEFDAKVAAGTLKVEESVDDVTNLRKVAAGRLDAAVIDRNVFNHLLATDSSLASMKGNLSFNEKILEDKGVYICFKTDAKGQAAAAAFNAGLAK